MTLIKQGWDNLLLILFNISLTYKTRNFASENEWLKLLLKINLMNYFSQDESGVMISAMTISLSWHDEYLNWTRIPQHSYYKTFPVNLPKSYIWTPDLTVWNSAGTHTILTWKNDSVLRIFSTGLVTAKISSILDTECDLLLLRSIFIYDALSFPCHFLHKIHNIILFLRCGLLFSVA